MSLKVTVQLTTFHCGVGEIERTNNVTVQITHGNNNLKIVRTSSSIWSNLVFLICNWTRSREKWDCFLITSSSWQAVVVLWNLSFDEDVWIWFVPRLQKSLRSSWAGPRYFEFLIYVCSWGMLTDLELDGPNCNPMEELRVSERAAWFGLSSFSWTWQGKTHLRDDGSSTISLWGWLQPEDGESIRAESGCLEKSWWW